MFYRIRTSRFVWREYREAHPFISAAISFFLVKTFRLDLPASLEDPNVQDLAPFETLPDQLPYELQELLAPTRKVLEDMGFELAVVHHIVDPIHSQSITELNFCHPEHRVLARLHYRRWDMTNPPKKNLFPIFITGFTDGSYILSSGGKYDCPSPEAVDANYYPKATVGELWETHQAKVAAKPVEPFAIPDAAAARQFVDAYHATVRDFHIKRGAFAPIPPQEQPDLAALQQQNPETAIDPGDAAVLTQMEQIRKAKSSWITGLVTLGVSVLIFLGLGAMHWEWRFVLMIIPILFFHELGHFIAMRVFGYRNVRMFFIPLLGAAVIGQRFNVAAWKKVVVSLMGPLPGILLGTFLGIGGLITKQQWMIEVSLLTLVINGFNLLPILPLDGGWVAHTLFFSRHPYVDVGFRVVAALGLVLLGMGSGDKILMYISIPMFMSLPLVYKVAQVTYKLRQEPLPPPVESSDQIPYSLSRIIISALRTVLPKNTNAKVLAQQTLEVYEGLYNRPPSVLATLGLAAAHGGAVFMTLLMAILLIVARQGDMGKFFESAAFQPRQVYKCGTLTRTGSYDDTNRLTILAQYRTEKAARTAYDGFKAEVTPGNGRITCFGPLLLLTQPGNDDDARRKWIKQFETGATNVFVENTNLAVSVRVQCLLPDTNEVTRVMKELETYFSAPNYMHLIPPWDPEDFRSLPVKREHERALSTFNKLNEVDFNVTKDAEWSRLNKEASAARRRGENEEAQRLQEQLRTRMGILQKQAQAAVIAKDRELDQEVVTAMQNLPQNYYTNKNYQYAVMDLAGRMGQLPLTDHTPVPGARKYSVRFGGASKAGLILNIPYLTFDRIDDGLPALAEWLCKQGARDIKFDVSSSVVSAHELEDEF